MNKGIKITSDNGESFVIGNGSINVENGKIVIEGFTDETTCDTTRTFKHNARYLTLEMQDGMEIQVDLGVPTGETREVHIKGHKGIRKSYLHG